MTASYALRGVLPGGGLVQQPMVWFGENEPTVEEAKASWPNLVATMPPETVWSVVEDEKPNPAKTAVKT